MTYPIQPMHRQRADTAVANVAAATVANPLAAAAALHQHQQQQQQPMASIVTSSKKEEGKIKVPYLGALSNSQVMMLVAGAVAVLAATYFAYTKLTAPTADEPALGETDPMYYAYEEDEENFGAQADERDVPPSKRRGANKKVKWRDEEVAEEGLEDVIEFDKQKEILMAESAIERCLQDIDKVKADIEKRDGMTKQVGEKIHTLFGEVKASFDDDQTLRESEQSLETAFMPKSDLDKRKTDMLQFQQKLGQERNDLITSGKALADSYNRMQREYINFTGKPYVPGREIQRRQSQMQQKVQAMQQMQPRTGQSFPETNTQPRTGADIMQPQHLMPGQTQQGSALHKNGPPLGTVPKQTEGRGTATSQYEMQRLYQSASPLTQSTQVAA